MSLPENSTSIEILSEDFFSARSISTMINDPTLEWEEILKITDRKEMSICSGMNFEQFRDFLSLILNKANFQDVDYQFIKELALARRIVLGDLYEKKISRNKYPKIIREVLICARVKVYRSRFD